MPPQNLTGLFNNPVHPGITVGTSFTYLRNGNHQLLLIAKTAYFFHRYNQHGLQILNKMLLVSASSSDETLYGLGIYKTFLSFGPEDYGYGHTGSELGYSSALYWLSEKNATLALLVNCNTEIKTKLGPIYHEFKNELASKLVEP